MSTERRSRAKGGAKAIGFVVLAIVSGVIGAATTRHFGTSSYTISFADFIAVMLSAVTLLMTLLGFIVALLAYIGWRELNERIENKVEKRTTEFLTDGFQEGNALHVMLQARARRAAYTGVDPIETTEESEDGDQ